MGPDDPLLIKIGTTIKRGLKRTKPTSSLSERCSLAPCGRLISGKIAQKQAKNGHEALCYRALPILSCKRSWGSR